MKKIYESPSVEKSILMAEAKQGSLGLPCFLGLFRKWIYGL